ncbi:unnamed protein product [Brassicogethes aeneus]|uniref:SURF1-like protein n=1 Tax=Brassicogethes aeneus TaxID=1431903 RepID=A0A9P0FAZ8_BRAAE|nr:unnamed protein product [Brassicogethes aeneus]
MFSKLGNLRCANKICYNSTVFLSCNSSLNQVAKPLLRPKPQKIYKIGPFGWFLLVVPASAFGLGTWQVQRKNWKESLLADLKARTGSEVVDLITNLDKLEDLEYKPVRVKGHFLHEKEMYMGPRSLLVTGDASNKSSLFTGKTNTSHGFLVVTPFQLSDTNEIILVNRGWVPAKNRDPKTREKGQVKEEVNLIGIVRLQENRPTFSLKNQEGSNIFFYRDINDMSKIAGTSKIFLDATDDYIIADGPLGGQTRISLRNEHMSYILTWYSLAAFTGFMWYAKFLK